MEERGRSLLLVSVVAALLFFTRLDLPLMEPQEPRYAEIPRQMLNEDSWATPILHGQPYLDKPPLLYWMVMASYALFGVHDWAARLIPACSCFATVLVVYFWGRRLGGPRAGLTAALVLSLSARYVYLGRMLTFDTLLCLWVTAALAAAHLRLLGGGRCWWAFSAMACGLGVLTKGPVALVLVGGPLAAGTFLIREKYRPSMREGLFYLLVVGAVAAPWFVVMTSRHPGFLYSFFWQHHVVRFVEPFDHPEPYWFHLPGLLLGMLPWAILFPLLLRDVWTRRETARPLLFPLAAAGWAVFFFSLSGCKRAVYILPALPPLALALGVFLDANRERVASLARPVFQLTVVLGCGAALTASICGLLAWGISLALIAIASLAGFALLTRNITWRHCVLATFAILFCAITVVMSNYTARFALRSSVRACQEACSHSDVDVVCYPRSWDSVSFYLGRDDVRAFSADQREAVLRELCRSSKTLLVVKAGRTADDLIARLPATHAFRRDHQAGFVLLGWVEKRSRRPGEIGPAIGGEEVSEPVRGPR